MSCSIVVIIDQSGSMAYNDYLSAAQTDASTFINIMNTGDNLGVVAFSASASVAFGTASSLTPITSQTTLDTACDGVMALTALNTTNMVAAFNTAATMIAGSSGNMGEVFLSDGMYNAGGNPIPGLASSPPIYTIALGAASATAVLQTIATNTSGTYNYAPNALQLGEIYNAIAGQASVAAVITNTQATVQQFKYVGTPAVVPAGATQASFSLSWDDWSVTYTANTPTGNQVNVFLTDPNGDTVSTTATASGNGYVVFKIPNPLQGTYTAYAWYSGTSALTYTAAIFDNNSSITMAIAGPREAVAAGSRADVEVRLVDGGEPIDGARLEVSLESPLVTLSEVAATHAERLKGVSVPADVPPEHATAVQIAALQKRSGEDLLPRQQRPLTAQAVGGGAYRVQLPSLEKAGSHTIRVVAHGYAPKSKTPFQRTSRISFVVSGGPHD
jgi:hypothetical protein